MTKSNWGIKTAQLVRETPKPGVNNSVIRVRSIETLDNNCFVEVRNWYNRRGQTGYPNMGKGIWIPVDSTGEVVEGLLEGIACFAKGVIG